MTRALLHRYLAGHYLVFDAIEVLAGEITMAADRLAQCLRDGGKILLCGNGGSAADFRHLAPEFPGRFRAERAPLAAGADHRLSTIGLPDRDGGDIAPQCDLAAVEPGSDTARIQEAHLFVEHALSEHLSKQGHLHANRHDQ